MRFQRGGSSSDRLLYSLAIGGSGTNDTLEGPESNNTWTITGDDAATITRTGQFTITFSSFENWYAGGTGNDVFVMKMKDSATAYQVTGWINGRTTYGNALDYSNYNSNISIKINLASVARGGLPPESATSVYGDKAYGILNIHGVTAGEKGVIWGGEGDDVFILYPGQYVTVHGGTGFDTLGMVNGTNTWTVTGQYEGKINNTITFDHIEKLLGGSDNDTFIISGSLMDIIDGGEGWNTLIGPNRNESWTITGENQGILEGIALYNIQNLTGGSGNDVFVMNNQSKIVGTVDGGGGYNTLDYSQWPTLVYVNLGDHEATNIGYVIRIQNVLLPLVNFRFYDAVMDTMYPQEEIFFGTNMRSFREWMDFVFFLEKHRFWYQIVNAPKRGNL